MTRKFNYQFGHLELGEQKIRIDDGEYRRRFRWTVLSTWLIALAWGTHLYRNDFTLDYFDYFMATVLALTVFAALFQLKKRSWRDEIPVEEIESMRLRQRFANKFLDIKLRNGKIRRVNGVEEMASGIEQYLEKTFRGEA